MSETRKERVDKMNFIALRIWEGQSPDAISLRERVQRIVNRLEDKGFGDLIKSLQLPTKGYKKYLK